MKEVRELIHRGIFRIREFQAKRKELEQKKRNREYFFQLMDKIEVHSPSNLEKQITYIVQNPHYFVEVASSTFFSNNNWYQEKAFRVHQPTDIKNYEAATVVRQLTKWIDGPGKVIGDIEIATQILDMSLIQPVPVTPVEHAVIKREAIEDQGKPRKIGKILLDDDIARIINRAFMIAESAITRRIVPEKAEPVSLNFIQQPLQLQLI